MQAINLEAKLEAKLRAVLFAGTAFAILVKRGRFRKKPFVKSKCTKKQKYFL